MSRNLPRSPPSTATATATATANLRSSSQACFHKSLNGCYLTANFPCCACSDIRPLLPAYPIYVDGEGILNRGTRWERYCSRCKEYWSTIYSSGRQQSPSPLSSSLAQTESRSLRVTPPLMPTGAQLSSPTSPYSLDHSPRNFSNPPESQIERITRLRTELQTVRTGIQRIVSGLNEVVGDNSPNAGQSSHLNAMSGFPPTQMPGQAASFVQAGLEASSWAAETSSATGPSRYMHHLGNGSQAPMTSLSSTIPPNDAQNAQRIDDTLRARQRAFLASNRPSPHMPPTGIFHDSSNPQNPHRRSIRGPESGYSALGTREEVESPDYQSPVGTMFGRAWDHYRTAEHTRRQGAEVDSAANSVTRASVEQRHALANPLISPDRGAAMGRNQEDHLNRWMSQPHPNQASPYQPLDMFQYGIPPGHNSDGRPLPFPGPTANSSHRRSQNFAVPPDFRSVPQGPPSTAHTREDVLQSAAWLRERTRRMTETSQPTTRRSLRMPDSIDHGSGPRPGVTYTIGSNPVAGLDGRESVQIRRSLARAGHGSYPGGDYHFADYLYHEHDELDNGSDTESEAAVTFDTQERPEPMKPESMVIDMACTICKEHLVDTVVMPCMHAVMCNWCAELQVPGKKGNPNYPRDRTAKCPVCRAKVKQKMRIFHA